MITGRPIGGVGPAHIPPRRAGGAVSWRPPQTCSAARPRDRSASRILSCLVLILLASPVVVAENASASGPKACNDGDDNDGDGAVDYPAEFGCTTASGNDESTDAIIPECVWWGGPILCRSWYPLGRPWKSCPETPGFDRMMNRHDIILTRCAIDAIESMLDRLP